MKGIVLAEESKVVVQGFGWRYRSREEWTAASLLIERRTEN